jgi:Haem-binding domain
MHSVILKYRIWILRLTTCFAVSLLGTGLIAGCSSSDNKASLELRPASTNSLSADPQVCEILATSCFDCHSDQGSGPWNAKLAPSYLFGANKARSALNFSNWWNLDGKQRRAMASTIAAVVDSGSMPPGDYDFFHPSAKLSDEQKELVLQWTSQQKALPAH